MTPKQESDCRCLINRLADRIAKNCASPAPIDWYTMHRQLLDTAGLIDAEIQVDAPTSIESEIRAVEEMVIL